MTGIYRELLDPERKKVFLRLKCLADKGTLAGGTAIFLQIKHRYSYDFDIFLKKRIVKRAFNKVKQVVGVEEIRLERPNHIAFLTKQKVQVTLFYYPFLPLYSRIETKSLPLFALGDLAADKAHTLGRRPLWRDYVDLFFLLKDGHVNLKRVIKDAKNKFGVEFAPKLFLEQLTYYGDIKQFKIDFVEKKHSPQEIQEFLKKEVLRYTKENL